MSTEKLPKKRLQLPKISRAFKCGMLAGAMMLMSSFGPNVPKLFADIKYFSYDSKVMVSATDVNLANQAASEICRLRPSHYLNQYMQKGKDLQVIFADDRMLKTDNAASAGDTIWVRPGKDLAYYIEMLAHEVYHSGQYATTGVPTDYNCFMPNDYAFLNMCFESAANMEANMLVYLACPDKRDYKASEEVADDWLRFNFFINKARKDNPTLPDSEIIKLGGQNFYRNFFGDASYLTLVFPRNMQMYSLYQIDQDSVPGQGTLSPVFAERYDLVRSKVEQVKRMVFDIAKRASPELKDYSNYDACQARFDSALAWYDAHKDIAYVDGYKPISYWQDRAQTLKFDYMIMFAKHPNLFYGHIPFATEDKLEAAFRSYYGDTLGIGSRVPFMSRPTTAMMEGYAQSYAASP